MSAVDPNGAKDCSGAIATLADFPVFDATVQHVIALCDDENATTADLVEALECDQSFSANLLRFANSAAQAHPIRAKSIRQAVMLVGRVSLRRLAIKAATFRFLERRGNGGVACGDLHMHAVAVAGCASVAADARGRPRRGGPPRRAAARRRQARPARGVRGGGLRRDRHRAPRGRGPRARRARALRHRSRAGRRPALPRQEPARRGGGGGRQPPRRAPVGPRCPTAPSRACRSPTASSRWSPTANRSASCSRRRLPPPGSTRRSSTRSRRSACRARRRAGRFGAGAPSGGVDRLTQLPDRDAWAEAVSAHGGEGSVVVLDVDGLAAINAAHGARVGDYVLTQLARAVMPRGIAGRVGGDEIALFAELPCEDAEELAAAIARQVGTGFAQLDGPPVRVTATVRGGVAAVRAIVGD